MYPNAYIDYLVYFHGYRDYFECHEVLEEHWKKQPRGKRKMHWVGLIQIAVGLYHERRGNRIGAQRMLNSALRMIHSEQLEYQSLGLNSRKLQTLLESRLSSLQSTEQPFVDLDLPITDEALLTICKERCYKLGLTWGGPSNLENDFLVHKHSSRDRNDVLQERERQLFERLKNKRTK